MKPTLQDIARKLGVNVSTVSRVINNTAKISEKVRKKVLAVAEELNYYPNVMARALITKRAYTIGLVVPGFDFMFGGFFHEVMRGIEGELDNRHYSLHLTRFSGVGHNSFIHSVRSGFIDGALVLGDTLSTDEISRLGSIGVPVILLNRRDQIRESCDAFVDNEKGGYLAGEHLVSHGYRTMIYIAGEKDFHVSRERLRGFEHAVKTLSGGQMEFAVFYCSFKRGLSDGYEVMKKVNLDLKRGTGIFAANDHLAIGAIKYLQEKNIAIGRSVGIIGYDNLDVVGSITPSLTSIDQKGPALGLNATKMLINIIEGKPAELRYKVDPELIKRESCGCGRRN